MRRAVDVACRRVHGVHDVHDLNQFVQEAQRVIQHFKVHFSAAFADSADACVHSGDACADGLQIIRQCSDAQLVTFDQSRKATHVLHSALQGHQEVQALQPIVEVLSLNVVRKATQCTPQRGDVFAEHVQFALVHACVAKHLRHSQVGRSQVSLQASKLHQRVQPVIEVLFLNVVREGRKCRTQRADIQRKLPQCTFTLARMHTCLIKCLGHRQVIRCQISADLAEELKQRHGLAGICFHLVCCRGKSAQGGTKCTQLCREHTHPDGVRHIFRYFEFAAAVLSAHGGADRLQDAQRTADPAFISALKARHLGGALGIQAHGSAQPRHLCDEGVQRQVRKRGNVVRLFKQLCQQIQRRNLISIDVLRGMVEQSDTRAQIEDLSRQVANAKAGKRGSECNQLLQCREGLGGCRIRVFLVVHKEQLHARSQRVQLGANTVDIALQAGKPGESHNHGLQRVKDGHCMLR